MEKRKWPIELLYIYIFQKYRYQNLAKISIYIYIYYNLVIFYIYNMRNKYSQKTKSSFISYFYSRAYGENIFQMSFFLSTPYIECII